MVANTAKRSTDTAPATAVVDPSLPRLCHFTISRMTTATDDFTATPAYQPFGHRGTSDPSSNSAQVAPSHTRSGRRSEKAMFGPVKLAATMLITRLPSRVRGRVP